MTELAQLPSLNSLQVSFPPLNPAVASKPETQCQAHVFSPQYVWQRELPHPTGEPLNHPPTTMWPPQPQTPIAIIKSSFPSTVLNTVGALCPSSAELEL